MLHFDWAGRQQSRWDFLGKAAGSVLEATILSCGQAQAGFGLLSTKQPGLDIRYATDLVFADSRRLFFFIVKSTLTFLPERPVGTTEYSSVK